jgi:hypothetical protein
MVLLIQWGTLDVSLVADALRRTFDRRRTHPIPAVLEPQPLDWNTPFERLAEECQLDQLVTQAFVELSPFYATLALADSANRIGRDD